MRGPPPPAHPPTPLQPRSDVLWGWGGGTNAIVALQPSHHPLPRRFESHLVRQLPRPPPPSPRPVEQKAQEPHEWSGEKVQPIDDRLSPPSCCFLQLLRNVVLIRPHLTGNYGPRWPTVPSVPPPPCRSLLLLSLSFFLPILPFPLIFSSIFISVSTPSLSCCLSVM